MRLFKPTYKSNGKTKKVAKWWVEFRDPNGIVRKWGLGVTDEQTAKDVMNLYLGPLNERAKTHIDPPPDLVKWVRRQDPKFRKKIEDAGLLPKSQINQSKPLTEHLEDYRNFLLTNSTDEYAYQVEDRVRKIVNGCGFKFWDDVDTVKVNEYIVGRCKTDLTRHTASKYVTMFRQFAKWMHKQGRISSVPAIQSISFDASPQRAFELDEWPRLLEAARTGPVRFNLTGHERYVLYTLAMESGLRKNEINSLTVASFDFKNCKVFVLGKDTKSKRGHRKDATQSITPETAALIKDFTAGKMPNVRLFKITPHSADMIRADCEAAGIEPENHKGKIKFHSLRHTCGSFLAAKGVHPKVAQQIMRHSKIDITMSRYTHVLRDSEAEAVNRLRGIGQEKQTKTETA